MNGHSHDISQALSRCTLPPAPTSAFALALADEMIIVIDCQTTGMRPSSGELLELAWAIGTVEHFIKGRSKIQSRLLKLAGGLVPSRIQAITGITDADLEGAFTPNSVYLELIGGLSNPQSPRFAVIHHSPFEIPFLKDLFDREGGAPDLPFEIFDSARIAKKLFPNLPSRNLRALAGFFGAPLGEMKRAREHVQGTIEIWKNLVRELARLEIHSTADLNAWMQQKPASNAKSKLALKQKPVQYEYQISKEFRLSLPERPGIYRMIGSRDEVLYVGKATSLRSRVNSYFRGRKGRDSKKLEMLTQVRRVDIEPTGSALEAAMLENEEIKRLNPPYNISLKTGRRKLRFYANDFVTANDAQSGAFEMGPYRPQGPIDTLRLLVFALQRTLLSSPIAATLADFPQVFYVEIPVADLWMGLLNFCETRAVEIELLTDVRRALAWGIWHHRRLKSNCASSPNQEPDSGPGEDSDDTVQVSDEAYTTEELADKFERLFLRAAEAYLRTRTIRRLANSDVHWNDVAGNPGQLRLRGARLIRPDATESNTTASEAKNEWRPNDWSELSIVDYDRLSVLLSELKKLQSVKIERHHGDVVGERCVHRQEI